MQNSVAKKIFAVGVAASTVLWAAVPLVTLAAAHANGTNISDSSGTVYMVVGGQRRPYTSAGAFLSYGFNSFASVVSASAEDLALPVGAFIPPQDGSIICSDRGADKGTCYEISGSAKFGFTSAAVFTGLGFSFKNSMAGDVSWMSSGSSLISNTTAAHLPGTLVNNNGTVQLMGTTGLLGVPDLATFNSWGYSFSKVATANAADKAMTQSGVMATRTAGQLSPTSLAQVPPCTSNCNTPPVVNGSVSATLASDTPAAGTIINSQSGADLAHFTFTGTGTITQVIVKRIGVSSDNSISNVYLYSGNKKLTDAGTFSNSQVSFNNANGLFTVNGTMPVSVRADISSSATSGQSFGAQLASFTVASGSPMLTSLSGNLMTVATVTDLATASVTQLVTDPGATITAGTMNATLWSQPFNIGTRKVTFKYLALKDVGSASPDSIQNIKLLVDGAQVATGSIDSGNNLVFDMSANPVTLQTGSRTIAVNGDVVKGSSFTFRFSMQTAGDIVLVDTNYGVNLTVTASAPGVLPITNNTTTISAGTVSVQTDPSFTTNQVVNNTPGVTLAQFIMKAYGENVKVQSLTLNPSFGGSTANTEGLNNLSIFVNGAQVGSSQNYIKTSGSFPTLSAYGTSNLFTIPAGTTVTVTVKGDLTLLSSTSVTSVTASLTVPANSLQGMTSYSTSPSSAATYAPAQTLSVIASSLSKAKNTSFASQTVTPNVNKQRIGSFLLQAGTAEPVRVTQFSVALLNSYPSLPLTDMANLYLTDGTDTITPVNPQSTQNFSVNFTMQPNETRTIDVFADLGSVATSDLGSTTQVTLGATATGVNSGASNNFSGLAGQVITVNTATLGTPTYDAGTSAKAQLVLGNTSLNNAYSFKFVSTSGNTTIKEMKFKVVGSDGATPVSDGITSVSVDGISAPVLLVGTDYVAYVTGLSHVIPQGAGGAYIYATPTFNTVGTNNASTNKVVNLALTYTKYNTGTGADQTQTTLQATSTNTFVMVAAIPTVTLDAASPNKSSGYVPNTQSEIVRFDVTPSTSGTVNIKRIGFTPVYSISSGTISGNTVTLYDLTTDPGETQALGTTTIGASGSQRVLTLTNDKSINSTHVFVLVADTATGLAASTSGNQLTTISIEFDLTATNDTAVGTGTNWQWNDNSVASGTYGNGYLVPNLKISGNNLVKSQ